MYQWGGVPPLVMLGLLCILSLEPIRSRFYESFYRVHILLAITYFGLLFWHAGNVLDSWHYLYATMAVWLSSWLARTFWYTRPLNIQNAWFEGSSAKMTPRSGGMTEIELLAPMGFKFSPMQHCFLRVPKIAWLGNHPFTICTSHVSPTIEEKKQGIDSHQQTLVFLIRTHSGFTKKLSSFASAHPGNQLSIWVEGPYGGLSRHIELAYDNLILIAGGGGITACLPWLSFLAQRVAKDALSSVRIRRVNLFWTVKSSKHLDWASRMLEEEFATLSRSIKIQISFHITGESSEGGTNKRTLSKSNNSEQASDDKITSEADIREMEAQQSGDTSVYPDVSTFGTVSYGRHSVGDYLSNVDLEGRNFVIGCGPASLRSDVANACAVQQKSVLKGRSREIALHLEEFGW